MYASTGSRLAIAATVLLSATACILRPPDNFAGHDAAVAASNFGLALAFDDDYLLARPYADDEAPRASRVADFERLVIARTEAFGALHEGNAEDAFGTLQALRREGRRGRSDLAPLDASLGVDARIAQRHIDEFWATRQADLAVVDARVIAPRFEEVAAILWREVDARAARGELSSAIVLGATIVRELPTDSPYAARLDALGVKAGDLHAALADAADAEHYGTRILHARLAEEFGTNMGTMSRLPPEIVAEKALSWTIVAEGSCGDAPIHGANSEVMPLTRSLPEEGFTSGSGQPMQLTVTFDTCTVTPREWQSVAETEPFVETISEERLVEKTGWNCESGPTTTSKEDHFHDGAWYTHTITTTSSGCEPFTYTDGTTEVVTYTVQRTANYGVSHRTTEIATTGTIRIAYDGGVEEAPFSLRALSDEDVQYNSAHGDISDFHGFSEPQARERLHTKLVGAIHGVRDRVLEARARAYSDAAQARAASGDAQGTEHAFFIGSQLTGRPSPAFSAWMDDRYKVTTPVLDAAVNQRPVPLLDLASAHAVALPPVPMSEQAAYLARIDHDPTNWRARRIGMGTLGLGLIHVNSDAGAPVGFQASAQIGGAMPIKKKLPFAIGFGERFAFGSYLDGAHPFDLDVLGGAGLLVAGTSATALVGVGGDFVTDPTNSTTASFDYPGGAYTEYGARFGVALVPRFNFDLTYTKAFRAPDALPRESRLDVRVVVSRVAVTVRYTEFASERDAFFAAFSPDDRVASGVWVLAGMGLSGAKDLR